MFKYFDRSEFTCSHTGFNEIQDSFVHRLDELREACGFPFSVNSGYRHDTHPNEIRKSTPGTHAQGIAADIAVSGGAQRRKIVSEADRLGFNGIGVAKGFVHVDTRSGTPVLWVY